MKVGRVEWKDAVLADAALASLAAKVGLIGRGADGIKPKDAALALASSVAKVGQIEWKDAASKVGRIKSRDAALPTLVSLATKVGFNGGRVDGSKSKNAAWAVAALVSLAAQVGRIGRGADGVKMLMSLAAKVGLIRRGADGIKTRDADAALTSLDAKVGFICRGANGIKPNDAVLVLALALLVLLAAKVERLAERDVALASLGAKDGRMDAALASLVPFAAKVRFIGRGAD